jgi:hypothetical protein
MRQARRTPRTEGKVSLELQVEKLDALGGPLKLQLGCGHNELPGWLNTDSAPSLGADYVDVSRPLPFNDASFAAVFCEHTIEHLPKLEGQRMAAEVFRVLQPGGAFRVATPRLEHLCRMVLEPDSTMARMYLSFVQAFTKDPQASIADAMNLLFYGHGHRHLYTEPALVDLLRRIGFVDIVAMAGGTYGNPIFNGVDGHGRMVGDVINSIETMAIEARKP